MKINGVVRELMKKLLCIFLACALCLCAFSSSALAAGETVRSTYVKITGDGFVADTFCGVPAYYNLSSDIQCNEYIMRFYRQAYGLEVYAYFGFGLQMVSPGYDFKKTSSPKPGDVYYSPAEKRGKSYDHWAIVKSYDASARTITVIEQNYSYTKNGAPHASVNRVVRFPYSTYDVYTPISTTGGAVPALDLPETTTKRPTTTKKPATTKKPVTTKKPTTQKATAASTTAPSTTVTTQPATELTSAASTLPNETTARAITTQAAAANAQTEQPAGRSKLLLSILGAVLAALLLAAIVLLVRRKRRL